MQSDYTQRRCTVHKTFSSSELHIPPSHYPTALACLTPSRTQHQLLFTASSALTQWCQHTCSLLQQNTQDWFLVVHLCITNTDKNFTKSLYTIYYFFWGGGLALLRDDIQYIIQLTHFKYNLMFFDKFVQPHNHHNHDSKNFCHPKKLPPATLHSISFPTP